MSSSKSNLALMLVLLGLSSMVLADMNSCTFSSGGQNFDFSGLRVSNGSYTWTQTVYQIDDSNYYDASPPTPVELTFELQVCDNVQSSKYPQCTTPSPINLITPDGNCTNLGDITAAAFDLNPYQDGAYLTYYHGASVNHIQHYEARIYFVCDPTQDGKPVLVEHMKTFYQWHFSFYTKLACV